MSDRRTKYWDKLASLGAQASVIDPNDTIGNKNNYIKLIRDELFCNYFPLSPKNSQILDFGCGTGNVAKLLSNRGYKILGIDISPKLIEIAKLSCDEKNCSFFHYDGKTLPINNNQFNGAVIYVVLSYIINETELKHILKQIFNSMIVGSNIVVIEQTTRKTKFQDDGFKIQRTKEDYINLFENIGFSLNNVKDIRSGHFPLTYLIRYRLINEKYFKICKNIDQKIMALSNNSLFDYRETAFILTKK